MIFAWIAIETARCGGEDLLTLQHAWLTSNNVLTYLKPNISGQFFKHDNLYLSTLIFVTLVQKYLYRPIVERRAPYTLCYPCNPNIVLQI